MCCKKDNPVICIARAGLLWTLKVAVSHLSADELLALCMRIQPAKVKGLFEAVKTYFVIHWFCDGVFDKLWGVPWGVQRWGPASNGEKFAFIIFYVTSSASTNVENLSSFTLFYIWGGLPERSHILLVLLSSADNLCPVQADISFIWAIRLLRKYTFSFNNYPLRKWQKMQADLFVQEDCQHCPAQDCRR